MTKSHLSFLTGLVVLVFLLNISDAGCSERQKLIQSSPEDVVNTFCQLDSAGARLSTASWTTIAPFVGWAEEAGAEVISVITTFKIIKSDVFKTKANMTVEYTYLGSTDSIRFLESTTRRTIIFKLIKSNDNWKIIAPVTAPHVEWTHVIEHLKTLGTAEPSRKKKLDFIITQIEHAAGNISNAK